MDKKDRLNLGSILEDDEVLIIDWVILIECATGMKKLMEERHRRNVQIVRNIEN